MKRNVVAVLVVVLIGCVAGSASAKMMGDGMGSKGGKEKGLMAGGGGGYHLLHMVQMLDLIDEQQKAVEAIYFAHRKEAVRKSADIDVAEIELQEILAAEQVNMASAEKKVHAIANFRAELEVMHLKTLEAVKANLTPEQREKLKQHMAAERMERMGGKGKAGGKAAGKSKMKCGGGADDAADDSDEKGAEGEEAGQEDKKGAAAHH